MVALHDVVAHVWACLVRYGYKPELITARESLRIVPMEVDREAYAVAWDERSGYDRAEAHYAKEHGVNVQGAA